MKLRLHRISLTNYTSIEHNVNKYNPHFKYFSVNQYKKMKHIYFRKNYNQDVIRSINVI